MIRVKIDTHLFDTGMIRLRSELAQGTMSGMEKAINRHKDDALNKPPMCPVKTGWMAEHHVTEVIKHSNSRLSGVLKVIDTPYAASLHEGISRWGTPYVYKKPGSGMKWIQSKVLMLQGVYTRDITDGMIKTVRAALKSSKTPYYRFLRGI